jgi:hypothetical protein
MDKRVPTLSDMRLVAIGNTSNREATILPDQGINVDFLDRLEIPE